VKTTFGTVLREVNPYDGTFKLNKDFDALLDTPIEQFKGTKKTFLKDSIIEGNLWEEVDERAGKTRKVVMVQDDNGRYLVAKKVLTPKTKEEIEAESEISKLEDKVKELLDQAKEQGKEVIKETKGFLESDYMGFTGKQILVASVGVVVLIKLFK